MAAMRHGIRAAANALEDHEQVGTQVGGLLLLLVLGASTVHADWDQVVSSDQGDFYLSSEESKKLGANIMIWVLRDHLGFATAPLALSCRPRIRSRLTAGSAESG
jgi:hypothetical protein